MIVCLMRKIRKYVASGMFFLLARTVEEKLCRVSKGNITAIYLLMVKKPIAHAQTLKELHVGMHVGKQPTDYSKILTDIVGYFAI